MNWVSRVINKLLRASLPAPAALPSSAATAVPVGVVYGLGPSLVMTIVSFIKLAIYPPPNKGGRRKPTCKRESIPALNVISSVSTKPTASSRDRRGNVLVDRSMVLLLNGQRHLVRTDLVNACVSTIEGRPRRYITLKLMRYVGRRLTAWFNASLAPTGMAVLRAPLAALSLVSTADCIICYERFAAEGAGLWCPSKDHFMCRACFQHYVKTVLNSDYLQQHGCLISCGHPGCGLQAWDSEDIVAQLDTQTTSGLLASVIRALRLRSDDRDGSARSTAAKGASTLEGMSLAERVQAYRRQIVVGCLTDKCPSCHTAITDQTACDAVVCANPTCGANFCGICFTQFADNRAAHVHVYTSNHLGNDGALHSTVEAKRAYRAPKRLAAVADKLSTLDETAEVKLMVLEALHKDLRELDIDPTALRSLI